MFFSLWFIIPVIIAGIYLCFLIVVSILVVCSVRGYFVALDQTDEWQRLIGVWQTGVMWISSGLGSATDRPPISSAFVEQLRREGREQAWQDNTRSHVTGLTPPNPAKDAGA